MPTLRVDPEQHIIVPDKATLCLLSGQAIGAYETFGGLVLPKGATQKFDENPGHYLIAGTDDDVTRIIFPYKVEFIPSFGRKTGVAFRLKQAANGNVYVGCVDAGVVRKESTEKYADLEKEMDWVVVANVQSFDELTNGDGFPLLNHVTACLKEDPLMKALKTTTTKSINVFCQPGKFGANLRAAWTQAEKLLRQTAAQGAAQTPGEKTALEASVKELKEFYHETEKLIPFYELPVHKRIVTIEPMASADINDATIEKLKALLKHFPENDVILEQAKLQSIAAAINMGEGNLKAASPLKRALRSAAAPSPAPSPAGAAAAPSPRSPPEAAAAAAEEEATLEEAQPSPRATATPAPKATPAARATPKATRAGRTPGINRYQPGEGGPSPKRARKAETKPPKETKPRATGKGARGPYNTAKKRRAAAMAALGSPAAFALSRGSLPTAADDKAEMKDARKQLKEKETEVARLQAELDNVKRNVTLEVAAAVEKVKAEMAIAANEAFQRGAAFAKELMANK